MTPNGLVISPKPTERTASAYRFEVKLPANGAQILKVEQERTYFDSTAVMASTPDFLFTLAENRELSEPARNQIKGVVDIERKLGDTEAALQFTKNQADDLIQDQTRLRADIDSLNRVRGQEEQVRRYSAQLVGSEAALAKIRDGRFALELRKSALDAQIRIAVEALRF